MKIAGRLTALMTTLALTAPVQAADLSPAHWPDAERIALERQEAWVFPAGVRIVEGRTGFVSATASPVAVHAGLEALRQGGTAADAAVATALTQIAMMGQANVSYAGIAQLLYYDAKTRRVYALDAGWNGWSGETAPATIPDPDLSLITGHAPAVMGAAGRKTLVPGFMAGIEAMHRRFGRLPFADLFAPAIYYADHGVPVTPLLGTNFGLAGPTLSRTEGGRRFLAGRRPDGRFAPPGLGAFLRDVAHGGAGFVYRGAWAHDFVDAVRGAGGAASLADMAAYRVRWEAPLRLSYRGATVFGPGAASGGGCAPLEALNLLDHAPAQAAAPYWQDARAFRTLALSLRIAGVSAYAPEVRAFERAHRIGGSCEARLSPSYGAAVAGDFDALLRSEAAPPVGHHSASVVAVDRWGNVAALVHTSNTPLWGDTGLFVDGVAIPAPAGVNRPRLQAIAPGTRVPNDMAPLIVLRDGRPALAVAAIGTSLMQETVRLVAGLLGPAGDLEADLRAPPLLLDLDHIRAPLAGRVEPMPEGAYPPALVEGLGRLGIAVEPVPAARILLLRGTAALARFDPDGRVRGAESPGILVFDGGR
ncbi:MAG TPA: gamma-glutamyltransferase [Allosphingosinicella sp.]|nr:gamma-glutamyltransferase [Allosphingosinicella sp.]